MRLSGRVSLTLRLTVLFATVSTVVLLALGYLIGGTVAQHFVEQDLDLLGGKLDSTRRLLESVHDEAGLAGVPQALDDALRRDGCVCAAGGAAGHHERVKHGPLVLADGLVDVSELVVPGKAVGGQAEREHGQQQDGAVPELETPA